MKQIVICGEGSNFTDAVARLNVKLEKRMEDGWRPQGAPFTNRVKGASATECAVMQVMTQAPDLGLPEIPQPRDH